MNKFNLGVRRAALWSSSPKPQQPVLQTDDSIALDC